jgi:hypothetical protein
MRLTASLWILLVVGRVVPISARLLSPDLALVYTMPDDILALYSREPGAGSADAAAVQGRSIRRG